MSTLVIKPQGVCSREMTITYEDGVIISASVLGGCQGNLTGICRLIEGRKIDEIIPLLEGIKCRGSRTGQSSCPDQLAKGLKQI
ncbi:MAG: TIGR03905 family TSCPD domain-containing protein [Bacilli bacterium]|nr:TIGR03905 family TSCPD domain-containing protein [Bacilli bacterium]